jgi:hypothetical protein
MPVRNQSICLWSGYGFFVLYLLGIVVVAGFIPPPWPSWGDDVVAAYFHQRSMVALNDFAWISWIVSWPFFFVQAGAFGLLVLRSPTVTIPRWVGYLSIWFALSMFPASAIVFFYTGPLAGNGVFALYVPLTLFATWYNVTTYWVGRAIRDEAADGIAGPVATAETPAAQHSAATV